MTENSTLRDPDSTSILRDRRLRVPQALLRQLGWESGNKFAATVSERGVAFALDPDGHQVALTNKGFHLPPDMLGFNDAGVIKWAVSDGALHASEIDGRNDPSYTDPTLDEHGMPIPPSWLVQAFTSVPSSVQFLRGGEKSAEALERLVSSGGTTLKDCQRILDFGGGVGRILRAVQRRTSADLVCYDLHEPSIDWARTHMPFGRWEHGQEFPSINEPDESFDLIYAASVLTHLDEHLQDAWLLEWKRLLKPGGLLVVTFRGEDYIKDVLRTKSEDYADQIGSDCEAGGGFAFVNHDAWAGIFPEYYADAYHLTPYVKSHWGSYVEVISIVSAAGLAGQQDAAVLRK